MSETELGFEDLNLSKELLKAVNDLGFEEPSPIQRLAIPLVLGGRDMVGQAQTGTGKTAAFGLPILEKLNLRSKKPQAMVLCPTRELAVQVSEEINSLASHMRGVFILPVYGGQSMDRQLRALERGVQIIVGTPGRVLDHLERGTLKLDNLQMLVLDEADEMLDMGFREDIESVLKRAPEGCQFVCFSATMPKAVLEIATSYMNDPEFVKITRREITVPNIEQIYYEVRQHHKTDNICLLLDCHDFNKGIVFCSTKRGVDELTTHLLARGYQADALHGNLSQTQRDRVMNRFRNGTLDLLVATDVAARGLDIDDVDLVINYDVPIDVENYVHRIGRTGRAGRSGKAMTFVTSREYYKMREIIRYTKADIKLAKLPTRREVSALKTAKLLEELKQNLETMKAASSDEKKISRFELMLQPLVPEGESASELSVALLQMLIEREQGWMSSDEPEPERREFRENREFRDGRDFRDARDGRDGRDRRDSRSRDSRGSRDSRSSKSGERRPRGTNPNMERLFFNVGSLGRVTPRDIVGAIAGETGLSGRIVGEIEIHDRFSFVEVPNEHAKQIMDTMNKSQIRGMRVSVDIAKPQQ